MKSIPRVLAPARIVHEASRAPERSRVPISALVAATTLLSGCAISLGSTHTSTETDQLDQLEERIERAEESLGIEHEDTER